MALIETKEKTIPQPVNHPPVNPLDALVEEPKEDIESIYDEKDKDYLTFMQNRLEKAKLQKDTGRPEYNNKTVYQYYEENEKIANTNHLEAKKNPDDVVVSAGTVEQKLDSLLSHINNLNLEVEVLGYDRRNNRINEAGVALTDVLHDTDIQDGADGAGDDEKKIQRQRELLKQGTAFVQVEWVKKFEKKKKVIGTFNGKVSDYGGHTERLEKVFEGSQKTLLHGPNVYLGDMDEFYMENQPYIFVVLNMSHSSAKKIYGGWERFEHVKKGKIPSNSANTDAPKTIFDNRWRLEEVKNENVEIILYQDQGRDEFQLIINGVMMLPIGFPLSEVSPMGKYNITKQIFRILNNQFAYGGSFVSSGSVKELSALLDEMLKLSVLKTRKSYTPAYVNTSGRVIDRKVLMAGRISMGFDPQSLQPIAGNEVQGITAGEVNFFEKLQSLIDKSTVSDQFTGQKAEGTQTATQVLEIQRQARLTLGLTIAACVLMEQKLGYLSLWNLLANWFEPTGHRVDEVNGARKLVNEYRSVNRETHIEGEGLGERMIIPREGELPAPEVIRQSEINEEKKKGFPVRKIFVSPTKIRNAIKIWFIVVTPKEKETSSFFKLVFREMLTDMTALMQLGSRPNVEGFEEEFARNYGRQRGKLFQKGGLSPELSGVTSAGGENIRTPDQIAQAQGRSGVPSGLSE